jgi:hypothetical protein
VENKTFPIQSQSSIRDRTPKAKISSPFQVFASLLPHFYLFTLTNYWQDVSSAIIFGLLLFLYGRI